MLKVTNQRKLTGAVAVSLALCAGTTAVAQTNVVVPNAYSATAGGGGLSTIMRNSGQPRCYQVVYAASELTGVVGQDLVGMTFRMSSGQATFPPFGGGSYSFSDYQIRAATSTTSPATMSTTFATNLGADVVVCRTGPMVIAEGFFPGGAALNPFGSTISLTTPFHYAGGDLVIDIRHPGGDFSNASGFLDGLLTTQTTVGYGTTVKAISQAIYPTPGVGALATGYIGQLTFANAAATGACCKPDGTCQGAVTLTACSGLGGTFQGGGSTCGTVTCPQPGRCCNAAGTCSFVLQSACVGTGSVWTAATTCASTCPTGACCQADGTCNQQYQTPCTTGGGNFAGVGVDCVTAACPQPGACCKSAGVCSFVAQFACLNTGGVFAGVGITCPPTPACNPQYFYDDGLGENSIGFNALSVSVAWLNRYTVANNLSSINAIEVAFGTRTESSLNGVPVDVYLWSDPNNDGNPTDAVVLSTVSSFVTNANTNIFNVFTLPSPVNVGPNGTNFFVGAIVTASATTTAGIFPARTDQSHSQGKSWISGNANNTPVSPNALATSGTGIAVIDTLGAGLGGNWMVRADATAVVTCYPNCDNSTQPPVLNVGDFTCFLQKYAASDPYANCDNSTQPPVLNVGDFTCFLQKYAAGCT